MNKNVKFWHSLKVNPGFWSSRLATQWRMGVGRQRGTKLREVGDFEPPVPFPPFHTHTHTHAHAPTHTHTHTRTRTHTQNKRDLLEKISAEDNNKIMFILFSINIFKRLFWILCSNNLSNPYSILKERDSLFVSTFLWSQDKSHFSRNYTAFVLGISTFRLTFFELDCRPTLCNEVDYLHVCRWSPVFRSK